MTGWGEGAGGSIQVTKGSILAYWLEENQYYENSLSQTLMARRNEYGRGTKQCAHSTASLSHLRTMLPKSSSRPLPAKAAQSRNLVLI